MWIVSKERVGSIIFFLVGFYGLIFGIQIPVGKWNEPGPGIFPLFLSILLCAFGILWFILGKDKEKAKIPWASFIKQIINTVRTPAKIVLVTAVLILVLNWLGYLIASVIFLLAVYLWISRYNIWISLGFSLVVGGGSWYFFGKLLSAQLPQGILPW
jgi:putative tricarboxylic transport membrane protein